MSQFLDLAAMNAALKELYDGQVVENLVYTDNPFFALVTKKKDFGGKYKPIPIITGTSQGRSANFSNAQGNQAPVQVESFLLTRSTDYSIATIDNQTLLASATDKMSFLEGSKLMIDGAFRVITNSIASSLFRSGTGSIGQVGSIATGVITLLNNGDVVQYEINQTLVASATDGGAPRATVGYVVAVDRILGTVTVAASMGGAAASPAGWTANDFLAVQGDTNAKIKGLAAWLPQTVSGADNFYGVNRSVDRVRLAGLFLDTSAAPIEEGVIDASSILAREGGKPNVMIVSFTSYAALEKSLGSKVQYVDLKGPADIGFRGIMINGANSMIKVFPDRSCQPLTGWLLTMSTWAIEGLGDVPQILKYGDGAEMMRLSNSDSAEVRIAAYYALRTNAPGWNAQVKLSA